MAMHWRLSSFQMYFMPACSSQISLSISLFISLSLSKCLKSILGSGRPLDMIGQKPSTSSSLNLNTCYCSHNDLVAFSSWKYFSWLFWFLSNLDQILVNWSANCLASHRYKLPPQDHFPKHSMFMTWVKHTTSHNNGVCL